MDDLGEPTYLCRELDGEHSVSSLVFRLDDEGDMFLHQVTAYWLYLFVLGDL